MAEKKTKTAEAGAPEKIVEKKPAKSTASKPAVKKEKATESSAKVSKSNGYQSRFKVHFEKEVKPMLLKEFAYKSVMAIPTIEKIVVNMGVGEAISDKNVADAAVNDLSLLSGQKAMKTFARKSVSNFKLREGMAIGAKVTLRKDRMFDFLDKLISIALPRVRDFRGVKASGFDGRGNFSFGISEQIIFPEINYDKIDRVRGMDITIVTTAKTDQEAKSLLTSFGFPFKHK
ncbi:MAG: 50S ribosomal protein L5 [Brevinemataceae bacterium]